MEAPGPRADRHAVGIIRRALGAAALAVLAASATAAGNQNASPVNDTRWQALKSHYYGDRPIADGQGVIALVIPERAYDAALVPVTIRASFPQSAERHVKTITLLIDMNPGPLAGRFHLTPASGIASISTRVRINEYSNVRAVAELDDGSLHMVSRYVRAAGGCSAPAPKDYEATLARMGKMKLARPLDEILGQPNRAKLAISHPNYSGMQMDAATKAYIPAEFVREVEVRHAGELVMRIESDISISENPTFQFYYAPTQPGELTVTVLDSAERRFDGQWPASVKN